MWPLLEGLNGREMPEHLLVDVLQRVVPHPARDAEAPIAAAPEGTLKA